MNIKIATSKFSISSNIKTDKEKICTQIIKALASDCDVIHFPEGSLSGYARSLLYR